MEAEWSWKRNGFGGGALAQGAGTGMDTGMDTGTGTAAPASDSPRAGPIPLDAPFGEMVRRHGGMVYSIALRFLGDSGLAEDVAQEAFLRLSENMRRIESEAHLALWLRRVTARLCIAEHRRFKKRFVPLDSVPEPASGAAEGDFLALGRIRALVAELPAKARMALILRFQEDMSAPEIARALREPLGTVKSRLKRALATLREKLGADTNTGDRP